MCLIKTLLDFEYSNFTAEIDGEKTDYRSFIAGIANGPNFGGGISICPIAKPDDNYLNFIAVGEMKKIKIIGAFIKLKAGKILSLKQTTTKPFKNIKITSDKPLTVNVDGELYENIPFEVEIVSNTLKMYR
jgi:diacylglycerol kinase family enzyme